MKYIKSHLHVILITFRFTVVTYIMISFFLSLGRVLVEILHLIVTSVPLSTREKRKIDLYV